MRELLTRSHVHVDRVACPWLITRFIDSDAEFLFAPKSQVLEIAKKKAKIVNSADTNRMENDPVAAGLEAIAVGYSLRFPDDLENLDMQFDVYDALYAWCRLEVAKGEQS